MKYIIIFFMLIASTLYAQDWERNEELESLFWDWDVEVEVWELEIENGRVILDIEDHWSEDLFDVRTQFSTIIFALYDEAEFFDLELNDLGIESINYIWVENEFDEWTIFFDYETLHEYFNASRDSIRAKMTGDAVSILSAEWERFNRKSFLTPERDFGFFSGNEMFDEEYQRIEEFLQQRQ